MDIDFTIFCQKSDEFLFFSHYDPYLNIYGGRSDFLFNINNFYSQTNYSFTNNFLFPNYQLTFETDIDSFNLPRYLNSNTYNKEINDIRSKNLNLSFIIFEKKNRKENTLLNKIQARKKAKNKHKSINKIKFFDIYYFNKDFLSKSSNFLIKIFVEIKFLKYYYVNLNRYVSKKGVFNKYMNKKFSIFDIYICFKKIKFKRKKILIKLKISNMIFNFIKSINGIKTKLERIIFKLIIYIIKKCIL